MCVSSSFKQGITAAFPIFSQPCQTKDAYAPPFRHRLLSDQIQKITAENTPRFRFCSFSMSPQHPSRVRNERVSLFNTCIPLTLQYIFWFVQVKQSHLKNNLACTSWQMDRLSLSLTGLKELVLHSQFPHTHEAISLCYLICSVWLFS